MRKNNLEKNNIIELKRKGSIKNKIKRLFIVMASLILSFLSFVNVAYAQNIDSAHIYEVGDCGQLLRYKGSRVITKYVEYTYNGEHYPAYCLDKTKQGAEGDGYTVSVTDAINDVGLWRVIINGYPYKTIEELGVANKEEAFEKCISSILLYEKLSHTIIFCPEGKNDDDDSYIDIVNKTLFKISKQFKQTIRIQKYVGGSGSKILDNFANGYIDVLLAKKRLNEGIDIPSTSRAIFISSSTSEREFIQRRGRVLRPYKGKEYADIYDFIVFPSASTQRNTSLFSNEMQRVYDFIDTAENKAEALIEINKMVESK